MPRRISDSRIGPQGYTDQHNAVRTVRLESRDRSIDLGQRLIESRVIAAMKRPRHFWRRHERAFFFQGTQDAAVEGARPTAFSVQIDNAQSMQIGRRIGGGKSRREQEGECRDDSGDSGNKYAGPLHAPIDPWPNDAD